MADGEIQTGDMGTPPLTGPREREQASAGEGDETVLNTGVNYSESRTRKRG